MGVELRRGDAEARARELVRVEQRLVLLRDRDAEDRFAEDGGTPGGYEENLTEATGVRYRRDGFISDMDSGFYSADYLRAWIRSSQLRAKLVEEVGEDWWRSPETGERLRALFLEGTKPSSEEIAARLGFDPLDTKPLLHEIGAA